jgi:hypothetical protein
MRALAGGVARAYYQSRQVLGFPLLSRAGSAPSDTPAAPAAGERA